MTFYVKNLRNKKKKKKALKSEFIIDTQTFLLNARFKFMLRGKSHGSFESFLLQLKRELTFIVFKSQSLSGIAKNAEINATYK